ncbi:MAG: hypothetical protein E7347_06645 [Clostridiales bacterium]|nr:hypothetical protein [Clostridiales bacterium]
MKERNSDRDKLKLENWDSYVKMIDYSVPTILEEKKLVDKCIHFNNENELTQKESLEKTLKILGE